MADGGAVRRANLIDGKGALGGGYRENRSAYMKRQVWETER